MRLAKVLVLVAIGGLAACSKYAADRYSVSADNVVAIRALNAGKVSVGPFESFDPALTEIPCRGFAPIRAPSNEHFAEYIRQALASELKIADAYATDAPVMLSGRLNALDFGTASGHWLIGLTVTSSNGRSVSVSGRHEFSTSYVGDVACQQTSQAFMPAVQDTIKAVIGDPEFPALLKP